MGPKPAWILLKREKHEHRGSHVQRADDMKRYREHTTESWKIWLTLSTSQGTQGKPPKARRKLWNKLFLTVLKRTNSAKLLTAEFSPPEMLNRNFSVILSHLVSGNLLHQPYEIMYLDFIYVSIYLPNSYPFQLHYCITNMSALFYSKSFKQKTFVAILVTPAICKLFHGHIQFSVIMSHVQVAKSPHSWTNYVYICIYIYTALV